MDPDGEGMQTTGWTPMESNFLKHPENFPKIFRKSS